MGAIIFDETGEEPTCIYCGIRSTDSCHHLVAFIDRTFGECNGGKAYESVDSFYDEIEKFLARWAQTKKPIPERIRRFNETLAELLEDAGLLYEPGVEHNIVNGRLFSNFLVELLTEAGGEEAWRLDY